jgi:hypothetical protein
MPPLGPSLARAPAKARRREIIPAPIHEETVSFGKLLAEFFGPAFAANPRLKFAVGRLLMGQLPPLPRPPGRPGFAAVSAAVRLREKLRRTRPEMTAREIWREIYRSVIPQYDALPVIERREASGQLRQRVGWRLAARKRYRRRLSVKRLKRNWATAGASADLPANAGKFDTGETVEIAAKRAGFKSAETFQRAKAAQCSSFAPGFILSKSAERIRTWQRPSTIAPAAISDNLSDLKHS